MILWIGRIIDGSDERTNSGILSSDGQRLAQPPCFIHPAFGNSQRSSLKTRDSDPARVVLPRCELHNEELPDSLYDERKSDVERYPEKRGRFSSVPRSNRNAPPQSKDTTNGHHVRRCAYPTKVQRNRAQRGHHQNSIDEEDFAQHTAAKRAHGHRNRK